MSRISERQLEDWIVEHPDELQRGIKIVGRQISLPHGRLDLLGWNNAPRVIELKIHPTQAEDIAQVLRYVYDVRIVLETAIANLKELTDLSLKQKAWVTAMQDLASKTHGILVVTEVSFDLIAAADAAGIMVKEWNIEADGTIHIASDALSFLGRIAPQIQSLKFAENYRQYNWVSLMLSQMQYWSDLYIYGLERPWIGKDLKGLEDGEVPVGM